MVYYFKKMKVQWPTFKYRFENHNAKHKILIEKFIHGFFLEACTMLQLFSM